MSPPAIGPARRPYVGRFAPSPTGPLHAGSLVAALASWLDARAHGGRWLLRIEDVDRARCAAVHEHAILRQLQGLGLVPDGAIVRQSSRGDLYEQALRPLVAAGYAYPCACSRQDIERAWATAGTALAPPGARIYPGTCRAGLPAGRPARHLRLRTDGPGGGHVVIDWVDRRLGPGRQDVTQEVGDFVLRHLGGDWTYQFAVVVDDDQQGVTHVVRGEDLADNTPRQILLQQRLAVPRPTYLHVPLVYAADGQKLSKQTGAAAVDASQPVAALRAAAAVLRLEAAVRDAAPHRLDGWLDAAIADWRQRWRSGAGVDDEAVG